MSKKNFLQLLKQDISLEHNGEIQLRLFRHQTIRNETAGTLNKFIFSLNDGLKITGLKVARERNSI